MIGVALIVAILFIFPTFLDLVGLSYGDYMRPKAVFSNISNLSDSIFSNSIDTSSMDDLSPKSTDIPDDFSDF